MIPRRLSASFPHGLRTSGDQYFTSNRVRITRSTPTLILAVVSGTTSYAVELRAEPNLLSANCTCAYAADHGICRHIWATLQQADSTGALDAIAETTGRDPAFGRLRNKQKPDEPGARANAAPKRAAAPASDRTPPRAPEWKSLLDKARRGMTSRAARDAEASEVWPADRRIVYIVDIPASTTSVGIVVELGTERRKYETMWDPPVQFRIGADAWQAAPDPLDRRIAQMLMGAPPSNQYGGVARPSTFVLRGPAIDITLRPMCETGRCRVRLEHGERPTEAVRFDDGPPWQLRLRVVRESATTCFMDAVLSRNGDEMLLTEPALIHVEGLLFARGAFARFDHGGAFAFIPLLNGKPGVSISNAELPSFLENLYALPSKPEIELPPDTQVTELRAPPQYGVTIGGDPSQWRNTHHRLQPFYMYGAARVDASDTRLSVFDRGAMAIHQRDTAHESEARDHLIELGAKEEWTYEDDHYGERVKILVVSGARLMRTIVDLAARGWRVEAEGAVYRAPGQTRATVSSGIDWFELDAGVRYGDIDVSLQDLLAARKTGATTILLSDGTRGVIPVEWLARLAPLAAGGKLINGVLRYSRSQTGLLDAMLATVPEANVDEVFEKARTELRTFDHVAAVDPPKTFHGTLREYQREGLGWLHFLRKFGLGGCLADDMGLGKTVQVLALLDSRRGTRDKPNRPSLVVVPKSLVFNWMREANRFAPKLRLLDYTGTGRDVDEITKGRFDVVITTYGTLRRDAIKLAEIQFDYAILDESQAIKTSGSASAKAARLIKADHRLAMTGTPIENRLEELWSLFEFLNPGMLGGARAFGTLVRLGGAEEPSEDDSPEKQRAAAKLAAANAGEILARALRPVILRRTKQQVAPELPERIEQTLSVELEGAQRKFYDDLLEAYRRTLLERVETVGIEKSRMHVLEALLRLRQAACHPALADPTKTSAPSAKLDALIPALDEIVSEGHKALVFSQFTSFLALVRERLDEAGMTYEYLDGDTRDRQAHVDRFENDKACPIFLISLKAGGHGLNLTAADYVFILDPWWNPAVEAQAIDRAHRIGQTRRVIATRIVARNTIEEKILELQASKRALADAILGQDQGVLSQIGRAELEMLLQ